MATGMGVEAGTEDFWNVMLISVPGRASAPSCGNVAIPATSCASAVHVLQRVLPALSVAVTSPVAEVTVLLYTSRATTVVTFGKGWSDVASSDCCHGATQAMLFTGVAIPSSAKLLLSRRRRAHEVPKSIDRSAPSSKRVQPSRVSPPPLIPPDDEDAPQRMAAEVGVAAALFAPTRPFVKRRAFDPFQRIPPPAFAKLFEKTES